MQQTKETPDYESIEYPDLPNGWEYWSGEQSDSYYSLWFGTAYRQGGDLVGIDGSIGGFDGEVYWDKGSRHHVAIYPVTGIRNDDPVVSEYATVRGSFDSLQDALDALPGMIQGLKERGHSE